MKFVNFALVAGKLKLLKRTGWILQGITNPESAADHSYRLALMAMILAPKFKINQEKVIKMALIHDLAEAETGDVVTKRGVKVLSNHKEKVEAERKAFIQIISLVDQKEYTQLFDEYEENKSPEAVFVKQLDKIEMALQALEYEKQHQINLQEFFDDTKSVISDYYFKKLLQQIEQLRNKK